MLLLVKWRTRKISQPDFSQMVCVRVERVFEAEHSRIAQKMNQGFGSGSSAETAAPAMTNVVALASAPQSDKCLWLSVCARPYSTTWLSLSGTVTAQTIERGSDFWRLGGAVRQVQLPLPWDGWEVPSRCCALQGQKTFSAQQTAPFFSTGLCVPCTSGIQSPAPCKGRAVYSAPFHTISKSAVHASRGSTLDHHFQCTADMWPLQQCLGWQETSALLTCQVCAILDKVRQAPGLLQPVLRHRQGATFSWKGGKRATMAVKVWPLLGHKSHHELYIGNSMILPRRALQWLARWTRSCSLSSSRAVTTSFFTILHVPLGGFKSLFSSDSPYHVGLN